MNLQNIMQKSQCVLKIDPFCGSQSRAPQIANLDASEAFCSVPQNKDGVFPAWGRQVNAPFPGVRPSPVAATSACTNAFPGAPVSDRL